jgi:chromosome segregation ATPase
MLLYTDQAEEFTDYYNNMPTKHFAVERVAMFLMGRKNAEAKLHSRLDSAEAACRDRNEKIKELEKQIDGFEKRIERAGHDQERTEKRAHEAFDTAHKERQLRYKLEEDVSTLRKAVGELKAKELLGEES